MSWCVVVVVVVVAERGLPGHMRSCPVALEEASALRIKNDDSVCVCPRCVAAVAHVERALLWLHSALAAAVQRDVQTTGLSLLAIDRLVEVACRVRVRAAGRG